MAEPVDPIYIPGFIHGVFSLIPEDEPLLLKEVQGLPWLDVTSARFEYFQAKTKIEYTYGSGPKARTYTQTLSRHGFG